MENKHMEILKSHPSHTTLDINFVQLANVGSTLAAEVLSSIESVNANKADFSGKDIELINTICKGLKFLLQKTNFSNYSK